MRSLQTVCGIWQCHLCAGCGDRQHLLDLPAQVKPVLGVWPNFSSLKEQEKPGMEGRLNAGKGEWYFKGNLKDLVK